jgi:uncharacterized C2H2 Zn-finger protein
MSKQVPNLEVQHVICEEVGNKHKCPYCPKTYTEKKSVYRHINVGGCSVLKKRMMMDEISQQIKEQVVVEVAKKMKNLNLIQTQVDQSIHNHNHNHNLNVMCLDSKDNLLDILTQSSSLPLALTYIKSCALARLAGDCRVLQRIYLPDDKRHALMYANKSKTQYVYYNENNDRIVEPNASTMAKKLADILQRSYLKGMGCFKTGLNGEIREISFDNSDKNSRQSEELMPDVEPYDLQIWNSHIHELRDEKYQKKVLKSLPLYFESDINNFHFKQSQL